MRIPKKVLDDWKIKKEHTDIENIHKESGISRTTISHALNAGRCSNETFVAINEYFKDKLKKEKQLIKETLDYE